MKLEEIKTENECRENIVNCIFDIIRFYNNEEWVPHCNAKIDYSSLKTYGEKKWNIDSTPYDNVIKFRCPKTKS